MPRFDVRFICSDTGVEVGKLAEGRWFIGFSPVPVKMLKTSKAQWIALCPESEAVARTLASYFTQIADQLKRESSGEESKDE